MRILSHTFQLMLLGLLLLVGCNVENKEQGNFSIIEFSPLEGPRSGGVTLTLTGADLQFTNQVTVGGQLCTELVIASPTTLTCLLPANPSGEASVVVRNVANNFKTATAKFVYNSGARIDSVTPILGPTSGGTNLTILGAGFSAGSIVRVGGTICVSATVSLGGTQMNCTTTARSAGTNLSVTILDLDGDTTLLNNAYTYEVGPVITSITPSLGSMDAPASITILGSGFDAGGATVTIDGVACASPVATATSITCQPAPHAVQGAKNVVVTNRSPALSNGFSATRLNGYTYIGAPTITAISPANGRLIGGELVTLTGTNFYSGMTVAIGTVNCSSVTVVGTTSLTCLTGARSAGLVTAVATTVYGASLPSVATYEYRLAPTFASVNPSQIGIAGGSIVITAANLFEITPANQPRVFVNGQTCPVTAFTGPSSITCTAPAMSPGPVTSQQVSIQIINPDNQTVTQSNALTYIPAPTVTSVVQSSGPLNALNTIVVTGYGFTADTTIEVIRPGPVSVACAVSAWSASEITCDLAAAGLPGPASVVADVRATNSVIAQTTTLTGSYTFRPAPTLASTNPVSGNPGGLVYDITIVGTNFFDGPFLEASVNGSACDSTEWISSTQVKCVKVPASPDGLPGAYAVSVINGDGQLSTGALNFIYKLLPVITGVAENQGPAIISTDPLDDPQIERRVLEITGLNFDILPDVSVKIGGQDCAIQPGNTSSYIECVVADAALVWLLPFQALIEVTNADGQKSVDDFKYKYVGLPTITTITPSKVSANQATEIVINGTNLLGPIDRISIGGVFDCTLPEIVGSAGTEMKCTIPDRAGVTLDADIIYTQQDGLGTTKTDAISIRVAPTISGVSLSYVSANNPVGTQITITGTDFNTDSVVTFENGVDTPLTCTSITTSPLGDSLTCTVPPFPAGGLFDIRIVNLDTPLLEDTMDDAVTFITDPIITSVGPVNRGYPGDTITLSGTDFIGGSVSVSGAACVPTLIVDTETMTCVLPAGGPGPKTIIYTNDAGRTASIAFTYLDLPTVSGVSPSIGRATGGSVVTVNGSGFIGTGWSVSIGGSPCSVSTITGGQITCTTSAHAIGLSDVVVSLSTNLTATLASGFRYLDPPTPLLVTPATLLQTTPDTSVTITTANRFEGNVSVSLGGVACLSPNITDPLVGDELTCTAQAHPTGGPVSVSVTNGDGQVATVSGLFTYTRAPTITSITPAAGALIGGTTLTIVGTNLLAGVEVYLGSVDPLNLCASSSLNLGTQTITCSAPALAGLDPLLENKKDVIVLNTDTQSATRVEGYTYRPAPVITNVTPELYGPVAGGNQLTIDGDYFYTGVLVTINGTICGPVIRESVNRIRCNTPAAPGAVPGSYTLRVFNNDNQQATTTYNYVASPTVASLNKNMFLTSGLETLVINGAGFRTGVSVTIGGLACNVTVVVDAQISCETPIALSEGTKNVVITNPSGQSITLSNVLYFNSPLNLSLVSPSSGPVSGGNSISLSGTGFYAGMTITIGGVGCNSINVVSTNLASCSPAAGAAGVQDVVLGLTGPVQTSTLVGAYTYRAAPTITAISPNSGSTTGNTLVTITGANFTAGAVPRFNGTSCTSISFVDSTSITCRTPARSAGLVNVLVANPDGQTTPTPVTYTYNAPPAITSITPTFGAVLGGTVVTINGSNFVTGAVAAVGGVNCASTVFVNSTLLTCTTANLGSQGLKSVVVTNPDTQTATLANAFTALPAPTLSSFTPAQSLITGGITVRFTGVNFVSGSIARINGVNCTSTVFVSSTALDCQVPAAAAATGLAVSVINTDGQTHTAAGTFDYVDEARLEWVVESASPTPPNPDNFGTTTVTVMHTYTLKNVGTLTSGTIGVSLQGIQSFAFQIHGGGTCEGATLAPAAECIMNINFLGNLVGSGSYSAQLRATGTPGGTTNNDIQGTRP